MRCTGDIRRKVALFIMILAGMLVGGAACLVMSAPRVSASRTDSQEQASTPGTGAPGAPSSPPSDSMAGMKMDDMDHDAQQNPEAAKSATSAMAHHHMEMDGHMYMTELRPKNAQDEKRADEIVAELRPTLEKYRDYRVAEADGYEIFAPDVPQSEYHFTNGRYALKAALVFDPVHPTSLLYEKTGDGYKLVGAMYTARKRATEDQLNERVPLSVARWHRHINFCLPPRGMPLREVDWKKFGAGTIVTETACSEAGGRWYPQIFGWMVHVYPFETNPNEVWAH